MQYVLFVAALLFSTVSLAENVLVNGEFDGGYSEDPPGWSIELNTGECEASSAGFYQDEYGRARGFAYQCMLDDMDWANTSAALHQTFVPSESGYYSFTGSASGSGGVWISIVRGDGGHVLLWDCSTYFGDDCSAYLNDSVWLDSGDECVFRIGVSSLGADPGPPGGSGSMAVSYVRLEWDDALPSRPNSWSAVRGQY